MDHRHWDHGIGPTGLLGLDFVFSLWTLDTGQCVCPVGTVCAASDIGYEHMLREFMEGGPSSLSAVPVAGKRHH